MRPLLTERSTGILLPVTALPGPHFLGDLGASAHDFMKFLAAAGQSWWQMLPVNPIGDGNSPYSTISSFAGEPLLIALNPLVGRGWLKRSELKAPGRGAAQAASYDGARAFRYSRLRLAFGRATAQLSELAAFQGFCRDEAAWLDDFALFRALSDRHQSADWTAWGESLASRDGAALAAARTELQDEILFAKFCQFLFHEQWQELKKRAEGLNLGLIGDLPIFVSHRSADCWANQDLFRLDAERQPEVVAGCPPDAFNADGQLWGNALYNWDALEKSGFCWWLARLGRLFSQFDAVRLDHFIGFSRYWAIPAKAKTAREGRWIEAKGDTFFSAVAKALPGAQLIAEDLGAVTPQIRALRDRFSFPGMKVLQFGFDGTEEAEQHKAHNFPASSVAYTGTHDNNTTRGWFAELAAKTRGRAGQKAKAELHAATVYLGATAKTVHEDLSRMAMASKAHVVILPIQDVLGQGGSARINVPGVAEGNWRYRTPPDAFHKALAADLAEKAQLFGRVRT